MNQTRDSIKDIWGERTPYKGENYPVRIDERTIEEPDHWVQSACVLCSTGCGLDIGVKDGKIVGVRGRGVDISNYGRLGPKGLYGWIANNSPDRLTKPLVRKNGKLVEASWNEAMNLIVEQSKKIIDKQTGLGIGFYTSGQLFIEDYYTLAVIGKAGIGTPHMDGNTRLCTATAAAALKVSFGTDGQPGAYKDIDDTDCIFLVGHNIASQQTVLWMRILDRLAGPNPPKLIVMDPRKTATAEKADVHLDPLPGTNIPVLNGLLNLIIQAGDVNEEYINAHTVGFEELKKTVAQWTPEKVEEISGVSSEKLRMAAHILGKTPTLLSTALQGVYQSMKATAAAVQINNLHLIRGLIGKPGSGIFQMNGQPTSQNTRECGADGDLPGFRNWGNKEHINQLAKLWNVDPDIIPHWAPPTHAMEIWRYAEQGSIKMLWISGTNPAVSLPELSRIRKILEKEDLFVIVQDAFMTETAVYADVVLPAALWGEKTGTFTNITRTVHISHKAVEPPGEAKPDFDIFLDYAKRMGFCDKDGNPLIKWNTPEEAFEAWKECSRGRPCDYTGMSYAKLTGGSGIQWPCNEKHPDGAVHIYTDGMFNTAIEESESYGHDLITGAAHTEKDYKAIDPRGKAFIKPAEYIPPHETPDEEYSLWLTTGRLVYHFHTRTKTGRAKELYDAAPDSYVQVSEEDAAALGIAEGDMIEVASRRGSVTQPARIGGIKKGVVFIPFHYGYWDNPERSRAANELTITEWDAVSKQPHFKYAAVKLSKAKEGVLHKIGEALNMVNDQPQKMEV
ncbi:molybdopterin oxidoreductase family protein [Flavisolibacter ginsenosidimutans]|uniref:Nitrate reductase n=1 Tax=Flavisolibacter ginsenosidimutans TaxID=661481 RepID=A0A5B8UQ94_9BACT|nr:nitrate reductase [Flavisolibacter ginsenosidimutans]QEC58125.1 nitrate reductase [Flavisolibacter ginsenosidimutans]